jgi:hypothetical protein
LLMEGSGSWRPKNLRILLFSAVVFKVQPKNIFFPK